MANDSITAANTSWTNQGLFAPTSGESGHLGSTIFTDVQGCMTQCLATDGCQAISFAKCGTTPMPATPSTSLSKPLSGNTVCGANGKNCITCAKECNMWTAVPGTNIPFPQTPSSNPLSTVTLPSTVFSSAPLSEDGVFVTMEGVPTNARDMIPRCSSLFPSQCGRGQVNECVAYTLSKTANDCLPVSSLGLSPAAAYGIAVQQAKTAPVASKVGFVMDDAATMFALLDASMADADGNVNLVPGPPTKSKPPMAGASANHYFTYLRAFPAKDGVNKGKLIVRVNGKELVVGSPNPPISMITIILIILAALVVCLLIGGVIGHLVSQSKLRHERAHSALFSGAETLNFIAHPGETVGVSS